MTQQDEIWYEVWALGYTSEGDCLDIERMLGEFKTKEEAIEFFNTITDIRQCLTEQELSELYDDDYIEVWLEETWFDDDTKSFTSSNLISSTMLLNNKKENEVHNHE